MSNNKIVPIGGASNHHGAAYSSSSSSRSSNNGAAAAAPTTKTTTTTTTTTTTVRAETHSSVAVATLGSSALLVQESHARFSSASAVSNGSGGGSGSGSGRGRGGGRAPRGSGRSVRTSTRSRASAAQLIEELPRELSHRHRHYVKYERLHNRKWCEGCWIGFTGVKHTGISTNTAPPCTVLQVVLFSLGIWFGTTSYDNCTLLNSDMLVTCVPSGVAIIGYLTTVAILTCRGSKRGAGPHLCDCTGAHMGSFLFYLAGTLLGMVMCYQWLYGARLVRDLTTLRHTNADGTDCGTVDQCCPQVRRRVWVLTGIILMQIVCLLGTCCYVATHRRACTSMRNARLEESQLVEAISHRSLPNSPAAMIEARRRQKREARSHMRTSSGTMLPPPPTTFSLKKGGGVDVKGSRGQHGGNRQHHHKHHHHHNHQSHQQLHHDPGLHGSGDIPDARAPPIDSRD